MLMLPRLFQLVIDAALTGAEVPPKEAIGLSLVSNHSAGVSEELESAVFG